MGYWSKLAANVDTPVDHPWAVLLAKSLEGSKSELYASLEKSGELESYIRVRTHEVIEVFRANITEGMEEADALEIAMSSLLPSADEPAEAYETEGGQEEQAAALEHFLDQ